MHPWMELKRLWAGYPGGYKSTARGLDPVGRALPFRQSDDPNDIRTKIPALGHREYWYPALPDKDIKKNPQVLRMLGQDMVMFRGKDGQRQGAARRLSPPRRLPLARRLLL